MIDLREVSDKAGLAGKNKLISFRTVSQEQIR